MTISAGKKMFTDKGKIRPPLTDDQAVQAGGLELGRAMARATEGGSDEVRRHRAHLLAQAETARDTDHNREGTS